MLQASQLRNGTIFEYQDEPYRVLTYKHTHMGRGSADVRVKIKGLISGGVLSRNFSPDERFNEVMLGKIEMQYLYEDEQKAYFMDPDTYQQTEIKKSDIEDKIHFIKAGDKVKVLLWEDQPIGLEVAKTMVFKVVEAEPGAKGNSAVNIFKTVTTDTGLQVKAPLFIKIGDDIKVNTETGEYGGRS
jgi:elongation factor P